MHPMNMSQNNTSSPNIQQNISPQQINALAAQYSQFLQQQQQTLTPNMQALSQSQPWLINMQQNFNISPMQQPANTTPPQRQFTTTLQMLANSQIGQQAALAQQLRQRMSQFASTQAFGMQHQQNSSPHVIQPRAQDQMQLLMEYTQNQTMQAEIIKRQMMQMQHQNAQITSPSNMHSHIQTHTHQAQPQRPSNQPTQAQTPQNAPRRKSNALQNSNRKRARPGKRRDLESEDDDELLLLDEIERLPKRRKVKRNGASLASDDYVQEVGSPISTRHRHHGDLERPVVNDILPVRWTHNVQGVTEVPWGQIVEIKREENQPTLYYVHYIDYDRRLDEWVDESHLDLVYYTEHGSNRRNKRKRAADHDDHHDDPRTKVKNVEKIQIGKHEIDSWYFSPYPPEMTNPEVNPEKKLYLCEFCLQYLRSERTLKRHMEKCDLRHPPGNEIYRDGNLSVFELDGCCERNYCENLCLLAKLYLDHKTLQYDVEPFLFYVMTVRDERGFHIVGYFSKEKFSSEDYNLACILTLPQYQKLGYGFLLIQFSYCLSRKEKKEGTPERPLSDLGRVSYESYWRFELIELLQTLSHAQDSVSIQELQQFTMMKEKDILHTLQKFDILKYHQGQHILCLTDDMVEKHNAKKAKMLTTIKQEKLHWTPHDFTKFKQSASYI